VVSDVMEGRTDQACLDHDIESGWLIRHGNVSVLLLFCRRNVGEQTEPQVKRGRFSPAMSRRSKLPPFFPICWNLRVCLVDMTGVASDRLAEIMHTVQAVTYAKFDPE
jgi:hypothetical protein